MFMDDEGLQEARKKLEDAHSRYQKLKDPIRISLQLKEYQKSQKVRNYRKRSRNYGMKNNKGPKEWSF